jgi:aspartokinase/homoserine dehydrogenase 2
MTKDAKHIGVVVAGLGNIGQCFLDILPKQMANAPALENVHLVGLLTSKKALINNDGIDVLHAMSLFEKQAQNYDKQQLISWLENHPYDELIVIDITPSEHFSQLYQEFFQQGIHVIGANKWAASAPTETYNLLRYTAEKHHSLWLGNATVGAGLPINHAISDLKNSGDNIIEISGIFSGTLSWLFETYDAKQAFSTLLKDALKQGITEPDPREDLSGRDVQRKLLILARLAGFQLSLADISVQNLVPESLQAVSLDEFLLRANELDDYFLTQYNAANEKDSCIRYIARFNVSDNKVTAKVSLEVLKNSHAFAQLTPCDNVFQITSQWYQDNPLIIRGPGAGREVTAGGIHSDLVNICQQLATRKLQVKIKGINE